MNILPDDCIVNIMSKLKGKYLILFGLVNKNYLKLSRQTPWTHFTWSIIDDYKYDNMPHNDHNCDFPDELLNYLLYKYKFRKYELLGHHVHINKHNIKKLSDCTKLILYPDDNICGDCLLDKDIVLLANIPNLTLHGNDFISDVSISQLKSHNLTLYNCKITDVSIKQLTNTKNLALASCHFITIEPLKELHTLEKLTIINCIGITSIDELKIVLPNCDIYFEKFRYC